jgi:hypothetical protein
MITDHYNDSLSSPIQTALNTHNGSIALAISWLKSNRSDFLAILREHTQQYPQQRQAHQGSSHYQLQYTLP